MAKKTIIPGTLYQRGKHLRWWWKVRLAGEDKPRYYGLRVDGQRFPTTNEATAHEIQRRIWRDISHDVPPAMTEFVRDYEQFCNCDPDHLANKLHTVREFINQMDIVVCQDITDEKVKGYLAWLEAEGRKPKTRINRLGELAHFCEWLVAERHELASNPVRHVPRPENRRGPIPHLTKRQLLKAITLAQEAGILPEVAFAAYTGMRRGELMRLCWRDIEDDGEDIYITTCSLKAASDKHTRTLLAHPALVPIIRAMPRGAPDDPVFAVRTRATWTNILKPIRKAIPTLGRKGGGWHDFRRTLGSLLIQAGERIEDISAILGHSEIGTTSRYYAQMDSVQASRRAPKNL